LETAWNPALALGERPEGSVLLRKTAMPISNSQMDCSKSNRRMTTMCALSANQKIIVIDAGHGGWDPGKVSSQNHEEAQINLAIAGMLQMYLENAGATVFTTRADDVALGDTKRKDLRARTDMPSHMQAHLLVSIHQNAFTSPKVHGAQVFYYDGSEQSQKLAEAIQTQIRTFLDHDNKMEAKASTSYFLLKETATPAVIVECGFLTNHDEMLKLATPEYQQKIAWAIYLGILDYFK